MVAVGLDSSGVGFIGGLHFSGAGVGFTGGLHSSCVGFTDGLRIQVNLVSGCGNVSDISAEKSGEVQKNGGDLTVVPAIEPG